MILFVSSNAEKVYFAKKSLGIHGIAIESVALELEELQSDDSQIIIHRKALDAYAKLEKPLLVSDHHWSIPALGGFPGPYMHFINDHLTADDLLRLMEGKDDRRAILTEYICYIDGKQSKIVSEEIKGVILFQPEGKGLPGQQIISLSGDDHSIAYHLNQGTDPRGMTGRKIWADFAEWYLPNAE